MNTHYSIFHTDLHIKGQFGSAGFGRSANLDENGQTVVGIASCIQVVLVFLGDVWHQHIHQSLHRMVERRRETLVSGELETKERMQSYREGVKGK